MPFMVDTAFHDLQYGKIPLGSSPSLIKTGIFSFQETCTQNMKRKCSNKSYHVQVYTNQIVLESFDFRNFQTTQIIFKFRYTSFVKNRIIFDVSGGKLYVGNVI